MHRLAIAVSLTLFHTSASVAQGTSRDVTVRAADGTPLRATYFSAGRPGPGVVLLHMCDGGQRKVWNRLGGLLAARGLHVIAMDYRGFGESGGKPDPTLSRRERQRMALEVWPGDIDTVFSLFLSQPGVDRSRIGTAGASCGGWNAVQLARRHSEVKAMVLLAGGEPAAKEFLPQVPWMPVLTVAARDDSDAVAAMRRVLTYSRGAQNRFQEYATGGHGTDLFRVHQDLEPMIADWFVQHLVTQPVP